MSVIYKAEIKFPSTETGRDILLERQFPSFKQVVLIVNKGKSMSVIYKAEIKL
ncbi:hypothetical protein C800_04328 [Phocaeicola vulgatus dnLKV7]|uniref:Uncharacterized protein n=1 Tax=Phocaeicola vulgatus dnLKV7 TaxID=1235786 RepID=R9GYS1_PHOVU|nr:hypothetical protein C800_04328 [Phocaeicola vulgatus dnLKV7]